METEMLDVPREIGNMFLPKWAPGKSAILALKSVGDASLILIHLMNERTLFITSLKIYCEPDLPAGWL